MTAEDVCHDVDFALRLAHSKANEIGRYLHPIEVRWVVRAGFRRMYCGLTSDQANQHADRMISVIRASVPG